FVELPQKQYIGQFPQALANTNISLEGGSLLCGNDHAASPEPFVAIESTPLIHGFTLTGTCNLLGFDFFSPDEFLVLFAFAGFAASRPLTPVMLEAFCAWDYSFGTNCTGVYTAQSHFLLSHREAFAAAMAVAPSVEVDIAALNVHFLQFVVNGSMHELFQVNILDATGDVSWVYFGWCFLYAWAAGTREVVAFDGDISAITAVSGPLRTLTMTPNPAEVPQNLALVLMAAVRYITFVFAGLAAVVVAYTVRSRQRIEGLNLFEINRAFGLVWVGWSFLLVRSATAVLLLHTASLQLTAVGATAVWRAPPIPWYSRMLAAGELNWLIYVLNDVGSVLTGAHTSLYSTMSAICAWLTMLLWTWQSPCVHAARVQRWCVATDMDAALDCFSAHVQIGRFDRVFMSVAICVGCVLGSYVIVARVLRAPSPKTPSSLLFSAPAKYMLEVDDYAFGGVQFIDTPSALMAGLVSVRLAHSMVVLDMKKWRLLHLPRLPPDSMAPDRLHHAIPLPQ
ncbi:hypothetical protein ACHHYP_02810, partial [Achlya hypogyna]